MSPAATDRAESEEASLRRTRELSKLLFGNRLRLESAAALATDPEGVVYARSLAQRLGINDNQAAAELKTFEQAGLVEQVSREVSPRAVSYRRVPSAFWALAASFFDEVGSSATAGTSDQASVASDVKDVRRGGRLRSPLLRLQSDERLVALIRDGDDGAFEALVQRYYARLLAFCRHMLGSRAGAEDVLQEVFLASLRAIRADDRPINPRPWLYRIARNRCLYHLRRSQPPGQDSVDEFERNDATTTADTVHKREGFRHLVAHVQELPETQRTALLLREIDALTYEQIAEAMDTTVPSVKSLLVRARVALADAADARLADRDPARDVTRA
jgi:RNA polymerase sigma factor (sigma-70 family)